MSPTFPPGGVAWVNMAWTQSIAALSMHIGSGPGVLGASGMQVKPFVPGRSERIVPSAAAAMTAACLETPAGAAGSALLVECATVGFGAAAAVGAGGLAS